MKNWLVSKGFEVIEVLKSDANKIIAIVKKNEEFLAIVSSKKKIDEKELLKDLKKFNSSGLNVEIFLNGKPTKKILEKVDLLAKVRKISKIEEQ